jgi:hypothetical protein
MFYTKKLSDEFNFGSYQSSTIPTLHETQISFSLPVHHTKINMVRETSMKQAASKARLPYS